MKAGLIALAIFLGGFATPVLAQGAMNMNMDSMKGMKPAGGALLGDHVMPATVSAIDARTGMMDVMSEGMALKLHFPTAAVAGLKPGDKITLHLAFTKP